MENYEIHTLNSRVWNKTGEKACRVCNKPNVLKEGAGTQFDPLMAEAFLRSLKNGKFADLIASAEAEPDNAPRVGQRFAGMAEIEHGDVQLIPAPPKFLPTSAARICEPTTAPSQNSRRTQKVGAFSAFFMTEDFRGRVWSSQPKCCPPSHFKIECANNYCDAALF